MPPEQENQNSEGNSIPPSPQEPTLDAPIPPTDLVSTASAPVASEAPPEPESAVPVNNDISQPTHPEPILENGSNRPSPEATEGQGGKNGTNEELQTAQLPPIEPLNKPNVTIEKTSDGVTITEVIQPTAHSARNEPLVKSSISSEVGNTAKQERVKKKLEKIIEFLSTKGKITNDEVEKLLHVSDATATRYLSILEKEGKIKQEGRTGKSVSYSRI